jgi:hypothetical protein
MPWRSGVALAQKILPNNEEASKFSIVALARDQLVE